MISSTIYCPPNKGGCSIYADGDGSGMLTGAKIYAVNGLYDVSIFCNYALDVSNCYDTASYPTLFCQADYGASCSIELQSGVSDWECIANTFLDVCNSTAHPTTNPTENPTQATTNPTESPTRYTSNPTGYPTRNPTVNPTVYPTANPAATPTFAEGRVNEMSSTISATNNDVQHLDGSDGDSYDPPSMWIGAVIGGLMVLALVLLIACVIHVIKKKCKAKEKSEVDEVNTGKEMVETETNTDYNNTLPPQPHVVDTDVAGTGSYVKDDANETDSDNDSLYENGETD
eukprot:934467_1